MSFIRNLFAVIGLAVVAGVIWVAVQYGPIFETLRGFDGKALDTYVEMGRKLLETGNAAEATAWKVKVNEGLSPDDVEEVMKFVANEHNFKNVGADLPLYKEVEAMSGKPYRFVKIYMFCNALTAAKMLDYSDAFSAYLPCRITMIRDPDGQLWLYTLNMDLMIYGGKALPAELKEEAVGVRKIVLDILNRAASGEF
jgi:uncharacterized protein (DUF302 family)